MKDLILTLHKLSNLARYAYTNDTRQTLFEDGQLKIEAYCSENIKLIYFKFKGYDEIKTAINANISEYFCWEMSTMDVNDVNYDYMFDKLSSDDLYQSLAGEFDQITIESMKDELQKLKEESSNKYQAAVDKHLKITKRLTA
jgi:hypothetical protein